MNLRALSSFVLAILIALGFSACGVNEIPREDGHRIIDVFPNPAQVGDTITVVIEEVPNTTEIDKLTDAVVRFNGEEKGKYLPVTGARVDKTNSNRVVTTLGSLLQSAKIDSLIQGRRTFLQARIPNGIFGEGRLSAQLADQEMQNTASLTITQ